MILEENFPLPRNNAAIKTANSVTLLLGQPQWHCNLNHNKFSSLSDKTVVAIFPNLWLWRHSLCLNLEGIDPEKLYRATLSIQIDQILSQKKWLASNKPSLYTAKTLYIYFIYGKCQANQRGCHLWERIKRIQNV